MNEAQQVFSYYTYQLLQGIAQAPKNEPVSPTTSNDLFGNPTPERNQLKLSDPLPLEFLKLRVVQVVQAVGCRLSLGGTVGVHLLLLLGRSFRRGLSHWSGCHNVCANVCTGVSGGCVRLRAERS